MSDYPSAITPSADGIGQDRSTASRMAGGQPAPTLAMLISLAVIVVCLLGTGIWLVALDYPPFAYLMFLAAIVTVVSGILYSSGTVKLPGATIGGAAAVFLGLVMALGSAKYGVIPPETLVTQIDLKSKLLEANTRYEHVTSQLKSRALQLKFYCESTKQYHQNIAAKVMYEGPGADARRARLAKGKTYENGFVKVDPLSGSLAIPLFWDEQSKRILGDSEITIHKVDNQSGAVDTKPFLQIQFEDGQPLVKIFVDDTAIPWNCAQYRG